MRSFVGIVFLCGVVSCGGASEDSSGGSSTSGDIVLVPTNSVCPDSSPPTYDNFGKDFVAAFCLDCHSESKTGDERNEAPKNVNFDTESQIRNHRVTMDGQAAHGPNAMNNLMPPEDSTVAEPSDPVRVKFGQWLACL